MLPVGAYRAAHAACLGLLPSLLSLGHSPPPFPAHRIIFIAVRAFVDETQEPRSSLADTGFFSFFQEIFLSLSANDVGLP